MANDVEPWLRAAPPLGFTQHLGLLDQLAGLGELLASDPLICQQASILLVESISRPERVRLRRRASPASQAWRSEGIAVATAHRAAPQSYQTRLEPLREAILRR